MSASIKNFDDYKAEYKESVENPEQYWDKKASQFQWSKKWNKTLEWDFNDLDVKWFLNGECNITENCLDRHLGSFGDKKAIIWEPNDPNEGSKTYTFKQLHEEVCKLANVLIDKGVSQGDRVCLYMPMVPELAISVLACARIGAIHSVVFAGFSASALADRINDAEAKVILTSDGAYRGKKNIPVKAVVDQALENNSSVSSTIVVKRTGEEIPMKEGRDFWYNDLMSKISSENSAVAVDSEHPLFILYTSGSTGKPKGVVHSTGGYMVYAHHSFTNVFQPEENDIYWCTADIGWITGHSYLVYGPLLNGTTSVMFEGVPTWPDAGRFWEVVEKYKVNLFYTAPTAIRALEAFGTEYVEKYDLSSLRVLGSVGEPINEEAWHWYHKNIGKEKCPIVDTWWQTETGGIMISPLAGITELKPSYATYPLPGIQPILVDNDGNELTENEVEGNLCMKFPWPSIIRTTYGDHERCKQVYFSTYKGLYFTGDGAKREANGMYRILGRVDDVINVSGHRMGTAEVENAIDEHPSVIECAVVGYPHDIKGQGIYAYVICDHTPEDADGMRKEILATVTKIIGPIAKPDKIQVVPGLPKTRSGKIMRRILRKIASGDVANLGDTSTLLDPSVVEVIKEGAL